MRPFEGRFFFARQPGRRRARAEQAGRWHRLQRSIDPVFRSMTPDRRAALMRDMPIDFAWGGAGLADLHGRCDVFVVLDVLCFRSEEHTSELQSLMRISYAVFCLKKKRENHTLMTV